MSIVGVIPLPISKALNFVTSINREPSQEMTKQELGNLPVCNLLSEFKEKVKSKRSQKI